MSTVKPLKWLKTLVAVILLPGCAALAVTTVRLGRHLAVAAGQGGWSPLHNPALAFAAGYLVWLFVFFVLPKPMRTYVLGHELTHALWALLMGARVSGLRIRKSGGQVRTSRSNWAIVLAPHFFPFYAMLFLALFLVAHAFWNLAAWTPLLFFLVGLGWSFHITFTIQTLLTVSQPDVRSEGILFSAVVIFAMNLLTILVTAAALGRSVTFAQLGHWLVTDLTAVYAWTLDNVRALWHLWPH
jgi:hypothetical protein